MESICVLSRLLSVRNARSLHMNHYSLVRLAQHRTGERLGVSGLVSYSGKEESVLVFVCVCVSVCVCE